MQLNAALRFLNIMVCARFHYKVFFYLFFFHINRFVSRLILKTFTSIMEFSQHTAEPHRSREIICVPMGNIRYVSSSESATTDFYLEKKI